MGILLLAPRILFAGTLAYPNAISIENAKPGTTAWQITLTAFTDRRCPANNSCSGSAAGEPAIEGYAYPASVAHGDTIDFHVSTDEPSYTLAIYRMGWYGGAGGREIMAPLQLPGVRQTIPQPDPTGFVECDWQDPFTVAIPSSWVSGVYLAKLTADSSGRQSYIPFVVRNDVQPADFLVQCSVTTWQAYNCWGGKSLYGFNSTSCAPATRVSFLRPYSNTDGAGEFFYFEINLVRFLEREEYDVQYCTSLDVHERSDLLPRYTGFISSGHDEYWSAPMRSHVEAARDGGVNLAFLTANACYWQIRLEAGTLAESGISTMVCYKDAALSADPLALDVDPSNDSLVTARWRQPPVAKPESRLIGIMFDDRFIVAPPSPLDLVVSNPTHWIYEGTGVVAGTVLPGLLGNEMDRVYPSAAPPWIEILGQSPVLPATFAEPNSHMTIYRVTGTRIMVFAAGTLQWNWGLDDYRGFFQQTPRVSEVVRQMTRNLLFRFIDWSENALDVSPSGPEPDDAGRAWPVPFTPGHGSLRVAFGSSGDLPDQAHIYDLAGRPVARVALSRDRREVVWDGRDDRGLAVTPGIYWVTAGRHRVRVIATR